MKRFIEAQKRDFDLALKEIKNGKKESHYMRFFSKKQPEAKSFTSCPPFPKKKKKESLWIMH